MDSGESPSSSRPIAVSRAAASTRLHLRKPRAVPKEAGKRLIFKRAAAFKMTHNSALSGAPAVRSKLLCAVGGCRARGAPPTPPAGGRRLRDFHYSLFHFPPSGLTQTAFLAQPGTTACSRKAAGMDRTCRGPVRARLVAACLSNYYPRLRIPTVRPSNPTGKVPPRLVPPPSRAQDQSSRCRSKTRTSSGSI